MIATVRAIGCLKTKLFVEYNHLLMVWKRAFNIDIYYTTK